MIDNSSGIPAALAERLELKYGREDGGKICYDECYDAGYDEGYDAGYVEDYDEGYRERAAAERERWRAAMNAIIDA